jgi:uracil-DNA glycosylase family 4
MITPNKNCLLCTRLKNYRNKYKKLKPKWHNSPVESFGSINSKLLIVGLAPGLQGANKTGRPFTGDYAGNTLFPTLIKNKLALGSYKEIYNDGLKLNNTRITNSVRCVPPQNKPNNIERINCRKFLISEIHNMKKLKIILALGLIAHEEVLKVFNLQLSLNKFKHGKIHNINENLLMFNSYHCSRYNINTKRLTPEMFNIIIKSISNRLQLF